MDSKEARENDAECDKWEYIHVQTLLFNHSAAVVPRDSYYIKPDDDGKGWTLMIKAGVKIIPNKVYSGGMKGFVFLFKDNMTPRPFREVLDEWEVTYISGGVTGHSFSMASPDHTYFRVEVDNVANVIEAVGHDVAIAKLSWTAASP